MAYENLLIEVGLHGSPLQWKYSEYGHLATEATWFQNLWLLVSTYEVDTSFRDEDMVQGIRENDCSLIAEFYRIGYQGKQLTGLNIVRCFRNLLHVSDIVHCDGLTVDEFALSEDAEVSPKYTFPREQLTTSDFKLWKEALNCLCLGTTRLPYTLGRYLHHPHLPCQWYTNESAKALFYVDGGMAHPEYEVYLLRPGTVGTCHGWKYDWYLGKTGIYPGTHFASVSMISPTCAEMHLGAPFPEIQTQPTLFLEVLASYEDCSLWDHLSVDGDGEWICEGIAAGSLSIAHDGSYMATEAPELCSAGVVIFCSASKNWLKASVAEWLVVASNYPGELLGAVIALLILRAASVTLELPLPSVVLHCDNRGVISHGNLPLVSLSEKQRQADLIWYMKHLASTQGPIWEWVKGHAVERKGWHRCSILEQMNDQADKQVKSAVLHPISGGDVISSNFPFELVNVKVSGKRVSGSPCQAMEASLGYRTARSLFSEINIIRQEDFHLVWWDEVGAASTLYPKMYQVWLTKHVSNFCGNNVQLYYWSKGTHSPKFRFYESKDEYTTHIACCRNPGWASMFLISVQEIYDWIVKTLGDICIATTVEEYLLSRGETLMESCIHGSKSGDATGGKDKQSVRVGQLCGRECNHSVVAIGDAIPCVHKSSPSGKIVGTPVHFQAS
jgi:hypothetical protein